MRLRTLEKRLYKHAKIIKKRMRSPFREEKTNLKEERTMRKGFLVAAVLTLCIITATVTPLANTVTGYFRNIIRWDGAVTGTKYENASEEITLEILGCKRESEKVILPVSFTFQNVGKVPFSEMEELAVSEYRIYDLDNKEIVKHNVSLEEGEKGNIENGKVMLSLTFETVNIREGEPLRIVIEKMYGMKKADAPLLITGNWEGTFVMK